MMRHIDTAIAAAARLCNLVAGVALVAMLLHVNLDVIGRTVFSLPIPMTTEMVSHYYMVAVVFLPLAAVAFAGGHITVELIGQRLTGVARRALALFAAGSATIYFAAMIGRTVFSLPIPMTTEMVSHYYMVAVVFLPLAAVAFAGGHITVELIGQRLTGVARRALALFAAGSATIYFAAMTWHTGRAAIAKYEIGEYVIAQSTLTIWATRFLVPLGCGLLVLALVVTAIRRDTSGAADSSS